MKKVKSKLISLILAESFLLSSILPAWAEPIDFLRPRPALSTRDIVGAVKQDTAADGGGQKKQEERFLKTLREVLRKRPVVTPIPGEEAATIKAAGAILLRFHEGEWQTLLVKRGDDALRYPGFWVFPTGIRDENGAGELERPLETMFRELEEELGLTRTREHLLGRLGKYLTADRRAVVSPILFVVSDEESETLTLNPTEVADARWTPVSLFFERKIQPEGFLPEEVFGPDAKFGPVSVAKDLRDVLQQTQARSERTRDGGEEKTDPRHKTEGQRLEVERAHLEPMPLPAASLWRSP